VKGYFVDSEGRPAMYGFREAGAQYEGTHTWVPSDGGPIRIGRAEKLRNGEWVPDPDAIAAKAASEAREQAAKANVSDMPTALLAVVDILLTKAVIAPGDFDPGDYGAYERWKNANR